MPSLRRNPHAQSGRPGGLRHRECLESNSRPDFVIDDASEDEPRRPSAVLRTREWIDPPPVAKVMGREEHDPERDGRIRRTDDDDEWLPEKLRPRSICARRTVGARWSLHGAVDHRQGDREAVSLSVGGLSPDDSSRN
jgi:hypothetical protein